MPPAPGLARQSSRCLGFRVVGVSGRCLQAGFVGEAASYAAGETLPVQKDSTAYLTDADARFCDSRGTTLG